MSSRQLARVCRTLVLGMALMSPTAAEGQSLLSHATGVRAYLAAPPLQSDHRRLATPFERAENVHARTTPPGVVGGLIGAVLGGLAGRRLAQGACEFRCTGSLTGPTFVGALVGTILGAGIDVLVRR